MSHYRPEGFAPKYKIMIGWDGPLNTFFAHVVDTSKNEDDEGYDVLWLGTKMNEVLDICDMVDAVSPYCEVSSELFAQLYRDLR